MKKVSICQAKLEKVTDMLIELGKSEQLVKKLRDLEAEKKGLDAELSVLAYEDPIPTREQVVAFLKHSYVTLEHEHDPAQCRAMVEKFIDRITVGAEEVSIRLIANYGGGVLISWWR